MTSQSPSPSGGGAGLRWLATALAAAHLAFVVGTGTVRPEHVLVDGLLAVLAWSGPRARRFVAGGLALWLTGVMLDNQRFLLPLRGRIHTGDLWDLEVRLFPALLDGVAVPWAAYFNARPTLALDVACGFAYATYLLQYFAVLVAFFLLKSPRFGRMAWTFFAVNLLGVCGYFLYPAAPPWYVLQHGPGPADLTALPSAAGAARFDALFGIRLFETFYARNPNIFGAMPSLHTAYPVVVLWQVWSRGARWRVPAAAFALLVAFSAVYLTHHYLLDVIAGVAVALAACLGVDALAQRGEARLGADASAPARLVPGGEPRA